MIHSSKAGENSRILSQLYSFAFSSPSRTQVTYRECSSTAITDNFRRARQQGEVRDSRATGETQEERVNISGKSLAQHQLHWVSLAMAGGKEGCSQLLAPLSRMGAEALG